MDEEIKNEFEKIWNKISEIEKKINGSRNPLKQKDAFVKNISVREFIIDKSPSGDVQNTICMAYYLEKFNEKMTFTSKEIIKCFKNAKLKIPSNVPDKIQKAIARGLVAKGDKRGEFYVTLTGEKIVEKGFKKNENN